MNAPRRHARARAFTLVEVMVASSVMALALVGMIQVIMSGSEMLDTARKQTIAMQIIHGQMDQLRLYDWTAISTWTASTTVQVDATDQAANVTAGFVFGSNLPGISANFTCTRAVATVRTDLKQVTYTVTWRGSSSTARAHSRSSSTYVGKNGLYVTYQRS
jgi:prepilin-type N-terminal cleavage/methylation domain-containing protein